MRLRIILTLLTVVLAIGQVAGQKRGKPVTVTGTVTDTLMSPVAGALIVADGQSTGVLTRHNGTFKLKIRPGVLSLGVYTTNLGSAAMKYDGRSVVDFVLDGSVGLINFTPETPDGERDINVGYGTIKKKNLTTDVGYIDGQKDENASYTNIYEMIQGKVPGVQVTGNKITIRGINSINSGTDPLFVVDGVVVNSIDNISPRQVESITVLKGSDAAIYGSRGAGGVILISLIGLNR
jgi:TonB-dependent SusC/RagA subfamily outer membrane receptor